MRIQMMLFVCCTTFLSLQGAVQHNLNLSQPAQLLLEQVVADYFSPDIEIQATPLSGGHSTNGVTNLLITAQDRKYALRMKAEEPSVEWLQREKYGILEASKAGIGPHVYYTSADHRAVLMEFIPNQTLSMAEAQAPSTIVSIAKTFREAHAISKNPYFGSSEDDSVENIYQELCTNHHVADQAHEAIAMMRECNIKMKKFSSIPVNNHGDLNSRNVFVTPRGTLFIDWEYTCWADPFEDLSEFSLRHNYPPSHELLLLESYLERSPSSDEIDKFYTLKKRTAAMLCLYFHYFSIKNNSGNTLFSFEAPCRNWDEHMIAFANWQDDLPRDQFYFELAIGAFKIAKGIQ